jgi:hypothetical protein
VLTSFFGVKTESNGSLINFIQLVIVSAVSYLLAMGVIKWVTFSSSTHHLSKAFKQDLGYVGFEGTLGYYYNNKDRAIYKNSNLIPPVVLSATNPTQNKPSNFFKAFLGYGFLTLSSTKTVSSLPSIGGNPLYPSSRPTSYAYGANNHNIKRLVFRTIQITKKVMKEEDCNPLINPVPYAAYLFRMASLRNNPENKNVQKKALLLWRDNRNLELTFKIRSLSLEDLQSYDGYPDSWVEEISSLLTPTSNNQAEEV